LAQKLGKIKKPKVTEFSDVRKLFCLPLIPELEDKNLDKDLKNHIEQFWKQAFSQIEDLEKIGKIKHIFFESITQNEEQGLITIKQISPQSYDIIKQKIDKGAKLEATENKETLDEYLDWSICLSVIQRSKKVFNKVLELHKDVNNRRNQEIAKKIDNTLKKNEPGLLVMTDENRLQIQSNLPNDIQVFLIHPPALNDVTRWFRDYWKKQNPAC
jgi:hypothetical protein